MCIKVTSSLLLPSHFFEERISVFSGSSSLDCIHSNFPLSFLWRIIFCQSLKSLQAFLLPHQWGDDGGKYFLLLWVFIPFSHSHPGSWLKRSHPADSCTVLSFVGFHWGNIHIHMMQGWQKDWDLGLETLIAVVKMCPNTLRIHKSELFRIILTWIFSCQGYWINLWLREHENVAVQIVVQSCCID